VSRAAIDDGWDDSRESLDERELPQETDQDDDDDESATDECAACGAEIYYDATRCPHCGRDIVPGSRPDPRRRGWLFLLLVVFAIAVAIGLASR
jgi:DNA-directed RNA polymerase subunit RPC12/RpoP